MNRLKKRKTKRKTKRKPKKYVKHPLTKIKDLHEKIMAFDDKRKPYYDLDDIWYFPDDLDW